MVGPGIAPGPIVFTRP